MGDFAGTCDFKCPGKCNVKPATRQEFVGPVKIVLVESTSADYQRKVWGSAVFTFVMLLLGATVFTVFFFTMEFKLPFNMNVHVLLCTMGFQLFMTTGIMMFSSLFGGSMHMSLSQRKCQHLFLEASGVFFGVLGTIFALLDIDIDPHALTPHALTPHALTGIIGAALAVIAMTIGPLVYAFNSTTRFAICTRILHKFIAVLAFTCCNVCFALGLITPSFKSWSPFNTLPYFLIFLCLLYSSGAMLSVCLRSKYYV